MNNLWKIHSLHDGKVSDKWESYLYVYEELFFKFRQSSINLLEIGVQNGGSLEVWSRYFPVAKKIIGCDINLACKSLIFDDERVSVIVADANSDIAFNQIRQISSDFDIVIDDGSHTSGDIINSFLRYFPVINSGGIYIAEDLHCSYWSEFDGGIFDPLSAVSFFKALADSLNREHFGVPDALERIFDGFKEKYKLSIDYNLFNEIKSIEFFNSVCIVKKIEKAGAPAGLGCRVVSGSMATVATESMKHRGGYLSAPNQEGNLWSNLRENPSINHYKNLENIALLNDHISHLEGELLLIKNSFLWKLNKNLKKIGRIVFK
ncbi:class I SAM-dependent methyltransferase [Polynucleobacter sp. Fuers-14]|uniref:class I SAM-dependent methyltransferase n=1 Tax=Polynucleobacter sp. Fuers-14 TaxID=1758364 RepID=UPI001C0C691B|nr:class I SAM-dependent methyltransferase [Polynucleobacter sp. Fuers-14]MBU3641078.1 class I SAM-dependent methyltransferase [Polynucleobacter sp. Fuers-14]